MTTSVPPLAPPAERSGALNRLAAVLEARSAEYALAETRQTGKPIRLTTEFDVPGSIDNVSFFAGAARHLLHLRDAARAPPCCCR